MTRQYTQPLSASTQACTRNDTHTKGKWLVLAHPSGVFSTMGVIQICEGHDDDLFKHLRVPLCKNTRSRKQQQQNRPHPLPVQ